jgi:hypothetical protein
MFLEAHSEDSPSRETINAFVTLIAMLSTQKMDQMDHALKAMKLNYGLVLVKSLEAPSILVLSATKSRLRGPPAPAHC